MRKFITLFTLALLIVVGTTSNQTRTAQATPPVDCPTVRSTCHQIWWVMMYQLCMATIGTESTCMAQAEVGYANCVSDSSDGQCSADLPRGPGDN